MRCLKSLVFLLAILIWAIALAGCKSLEKDNQVNALRRVTNGYVKSLRWGYFENALGYLHPDQRKPQEIAKIKDGLRIIGFDDVSPPAIIDEDKATQVILWEYLYEDRQVVKQVMDRQTWTWDPELETWWLTSPVPDFK